MKYLYLSGLILLLAACSKESNRQEISPQKDHQSLSYNHVADVFKKNHFNDDLLKYKDSLNVNALPNTTIEVKNEADLKRVDSLLAILLKAVLTTAQLDAQIKLFVDTSLSRYRNRPLQKVNAAFSDRIYYTDVRCVLRILNDPSGDAYPGVIAMNTHLAYRQTTPYLSWEPPTSMINRYYYTGIIPGSGQPMYDTNLTVNNNNIRIYSSPVLTGAGAAQKDYYYLIKVKVESGPFNFDIGTVLKTSALFNFGSAVPTYTDGSMYINYPM